MCTNQPNLEMIDVSKFREAHSSNVNLTVFNHAAICLMKAWDFAVV